MSTESRFSLLFRKYVDGTAIHDERLEFLALANQENMQAELAQLIDAELRLRGTEYSLDEEEQQEILGNIYKTAPAKTRKLWPRIAVAASIAIVMGTGLWFYRPAVILNPDRHPELVSGSQDIAPGKNAATLILADGKKIDVNDAASGQLAEQHGVKISKTAEGQIVYELKDKGNARGYNTLQTSNGEQTTVRLQDGSVVNLNAASSLTYPASFAGLKERRVKLKGEGDFTVHHNAKQPFRVEARGQVVEDIGTEFNINAYDDEPVVRTTLVEGIAKVNDVMLKPNQQAILSADNRINVIAINAEDVVAWKNGMFIFNDESVIQIMQRISKWYDIEVIYEAGVDKQQTFGGRVSRFRNISEVLKIMQSTGLIKFRIEGKKVYVSK